MTKLVFNLKVESISSNKVIFSAVNEDGEVKATLTRGSEHNDLFGGDADIRIDATHKLEVFITDTPDELLIGNPVYHWKECSRAYCKLVLIDTIYHMSERTILELYDLDENIDLGLQNRVTFKLYQATPTVGKEGSGKKA